MAAASEEEATCLVLITAFLSKKPLLTEKINAKIMMMSFMIRRRKLRLEEVCEAGVDCWCEM